MRKRSPSTCPETSRPGQSLHRAALVFALVLLVTSGVTLAQSDESPSRLPDKPIPYKGDEALPQITPPIVQLGDPFFASGVIHRGISLPGGAVWQPRFWLYGSLRSAVQTFDRGNTGSNSEWANRLDLFGNLQLSGTERLLIGIQPLQIDRGFSGYRFENVKLEDGFDKHVNGRVTTLFFEGNVGEILPNVDPLGTGALDYGFSVGRQQIVFQEGMLINDSLDAVGVTRNSLHLPGTSNVRVTALYAWGNVDRDDNVGDRSAELLGVFTETDLSFSTIDVDVAYVNARDRTGDLVVAGASAVQRIGPFNTAFRALGSIALGDQTAQASDGVLLFAESSWTPPRSDNIVYVNAFVGIDNFASAARAPTVGGPLGRSGIVFAARGLGRFPPPLSNRADEAFGGALGYQMFFAGHRRQLVIEAGGRKDTSGDGFDAVAGALRVQQAIGRRVIVSFDAVGALQEDRKPASGVRVETLIKF